jgi:hypothetical protein
MPIRRPKWPSMIPITIQMKHLPEITLGASVSLYTGRPIVDFRYGDGDECALLPAEARKLAAALVRAAECCDAKSAVAKAWRSTPVREESNPRRTLPSRSPGSRR